MGRKPRSSGLDGLLLVDKPRGHTSHDVVQQARRALGQRKIGHCGTLDPEATGLLLLTLGRGTRLTRFLIKAPKVYQGTIRLGAATDTYDAAGEMTAEAPVDGITLDDVDAKMAEFVGLYPQVPPPYSAKKIDGQKFYELARRGDAVPQDAAEVRIYDFARHPGALGDPALPGTPDPDDSLPIVPFRLASASGTYARSLAHDLGKKLGCHAHLASLRRIQIGGFELANATELEPLRQAEGDTARLGGAWIPFDDIPLPFQGVATDTRQERRIKHGQTVLVPALEGEEGDWVRLSGPRGEFLAVGTISERLGGAGTAVVQPRIVFKQ